MSIEMSLPAASNKTPTSVKSYKSPISIGSPSTHSSNKSQFSIAKSIDRSNNNSSNLNSNSAVHKVQMKTSNASSISQVDQIKAGSDVTALCKFEGKSEDRELSFEFGDLIKIINIIAKDPQWALGELRGEKGFLLLKYVKSKSITMPWFHENMTREQAEFLLKDLPEGSYLMRESTHYPGDFTLCLKSDLKIENYHIKLLNKKFTIDDEHCFNNLIELVEFYTKNDHLACLLKHPFKFTKKKEASDYQALLNPLWINESDVKLGREIGIGEFGAVYRGTYKESDVAVKKIKDRTTVDEFLKEAFVMSTLSHPNLVKLIGVVKHHIPSSEKFEISLVTEYMPKGSLLDYLTSRGRNILTKKELMEFVIHICEAMSYLEEKGIVHRDLAASNVLISKEDIAKVSDFGLAKKIMDDNRTNSGRIRIKWTAPEAIKEKLYSNKSDVWSFGILLWEIFSYGRVPYPKIPVSEVLNQIEHGYQMEKPDGCPDEIYSLMKETWHHDRTLRPTFSQTLKNLYKIKVKILER